MRTIVLVTCVMSLTMLGCQNKKTPAYEAPGPSSGQMESRPLTDLTAPGETAAPTADEPQSNAPAAPVAPQAAGRTVVVQKGDTLWSLSKRYLGDGRRWQEIVSANPGLDPKALRVGQTIVLPEK